MRTTLTEYTDIEVATCFSRMSNMDIKKDINLSKMSFNNVGTVEQATKFKEVLQMIFSNVLLNINNEIIQGDLKNKIKDKLKNLRNKISPESLKKLERTFR